MRAEDEYLLDLLSNNKVIFSIPPYQRNYEWDDEQCSVFFDDVAKVTASNLAGEPTEHFIGTVVYVRDDDSDDFGVKRYILVDGQQRITTTMLFLIALRDCSDDESTREDIDSDYLKNARAHSDDEYKVKLKQVETDWPAYRNLVIGHELTAEQKQTRIAQNYAFFRKKLEAYKQDGGDLGALISRGLLKFSVVVIRLEPQRNKWEDPQEIFESMNSLGKPLSLADLVRNWLLMSEGAEEQENLYHDFWLPMEQRLGAGKGEQVSNFVRDYMQMVKCAPLKKATAHNYKGLYAEFKSIFASKPSRALLTDMESCSRLYACIALGAPSGNADIDRKLTDLRNIKTTTSYSFILALLQTWNSGKLSDADLLGVLEALFIYLFRRRIIGMAKAENKSIPELTKHVPDIARAADPHQAMFELLAGQGYALRLPTNAEVAVELRSMNFYSFKQAKFLLALAEEQLTKSLPDLSDSHLQLEHIMPQTLSDAWRKDLGEDAENVHAELVNNIGNLTLIRHNQELGNKPFAAKKKTYEGHAGMQISRESITDCSTWNGDTITARANWLVGYITTQVLPIPHELDNTAATATRERRPNASLVDLGLVGEKITYIDNPKLTAIAVSDRQVEFEGKKYTLSGLTRELKTRAGTINPSGSYNGWAHWAYNGTALVDMTVPDDLDDDIDDEDEE